MSQTKQVKQLDRVIIRFAGDSGDGMQLTGDRFTQESAVFGNDLVTLPNFPAEIRAPAGTIPGVSSFQVHFADHDILTAGDRPDVLVAMNPAALKANLGDLPRGATIIVDTHDFTKRNLDKAGYTSNPLDKLGEVDDELAAFNVQPVDLTGIAVAAVTEFGLSRKDAARSKNMFALGLALWARCGPAAEGKLERHHFARWAENHYQYVGPFADYLGIVYANTPDTCTEAKDFLLQNMYEEELADIRHTDAKAWGTIVNDD